MTAWRDLALAPGLFARLAAPPFAWAVAAALPGLADAAAGRPIPRETLRAATLAIEALKLIAVGASLGVLSHAHRRLFGDGAVAPAADA